MLHILALAAMTAAAAPAVVSTEWLEAHLQDPQVRIIHVGDAGGYALAHIPGARLLEQSETMGRPGLPAPDVLVRAFTTAGAADGAHVVLYGDSPMSIGWVYIALMSIGHGDEVSWLDGGLELWRREKRPVSDVSSATPEAGAGPLTVRGTSDLIVDSTWLQSRLESPATKILDVRTDQEWSNGHLPNATLVTWQDLYQDVKAQKLKSPEQIRGLLAAAGVAPNQEVVTYCAVGMRASLMFWAARSAGVPARVYVGSWSDWSRNPANPIVK